MYVAVPAVMLAVLFFEVELVVFVAAVNIDAVAVVIVAAVVVNGGCGFCGVDCILFC